MAVHVKLGKIGELVMASGYLPGNRNLSAPSNVDKLIRYCQDKSMPLIVGCDDNIHPVM